MVFICTEVHCTIYSFGLHKYTNSHTYREREQAREECTHYTYDRIQRDFHLIFLYLVFFSFRNAGAIVKESAEQKAAPTTNAAAIENEEKNECKDQI